MTETKMTTTTETETETEPKIDNTIHNILILSTDKFYHGIGGLCTQLRETVNAFHELNLPYYFILVTPEKEEITGPNYKVVPMISTQCQSLTPFNEYLSVINRSGSYVGAAMDYLCKNNIKLKCIHAFDWGTFTAAQILCHYFNAPYVASIALSIQKEVAAYRKHYSTILSPASNEMHVFQVCCMIEASGMQKASKILFNTFEYANSVAGPFGNKSHVITNGVPFTYIKNLKVPDNFKLPGRSLAKKLVFIGRLTLSKNVMNVLQAKLPDNVDLIVIGSETQGAEKLVVGAVYECAQNNQNVHYVGGKYDDEKFYFLKSADAVIMPSIHEPFGIVALEALASGCVLLSSVVDGLAEFLDDTVCIPCGVSPDTITQAIQKWNNMNDGDVKNLVGRGLERASKYDWKDIALKTEKIIYEKI
jgi:1,4-alpha-glucan branching enzyme